MLAYLLAVAHKWAMARLMKFSEFPFAIDSLQLVSAILCALESQMQIEISSYLLDKRPQRLERTPLALPQVDNSLLSTVQHHVRPIREFKRHPARGAAAAAAAGPLTVDVSMKDLELTPIWLL